MVAMTTRYGYFLSGFFEFHARQVLPRLREG